MMRRLLRPLVVSLTAVLAATVAGAVCASAQSAGDILFRDVRVFTGDEVISRTSVLVSRGRVQRIAPELQAPAGAVVVEGAGRTLMPGLIDAHVHVFGGALQEALVFGVTTALDMFSDTHVAAGLRRQQAGDGAPDRADIFSAGTLVTAPGGHGTQFGVAIPTLSHADSADAFVAERIAEGSDWIKVIYEDGSAFGGSFPSVDAATLRATIDAAHTRGLKAVVHVSTATAARTALEAGADGLVHIFIDRPLDDATLQIARQRGAFVVPTLVVLRSMTGEGGAAPLVSDARLQPYLMPAMRDQLTQNYGGRPGAAALYGNAADATRRLHEAGVPILAGSDAPNPGTAHGAALHRELELLVEAGLTPLAALRAATSLPADHFGLGDRGRIAEGLRADLVLVAGDPTADITATRAIAGVWKAGVPADRDAWAANVAAAVQRAQQGALDAGRALVAGLISDFESERPDAEFGTEWMPSTDAMMGGSSTTQFRVVDGGAHGARSLLIEGALDGGLPSAWAGVMWSPGAQPMSPMDLSARQGLRFSTRGDGREYAVMIFARSRGMTPIMSPFTAPSDWTEVSVPWSEFGVDGSDVMAVLFVAMPPGGSYRFQVDHVRLF